MHFSLNRPQAPPLGTCVTPAVKDCLTCGLGHTLMPFLLARAAIVIEVRRFESTLGESARLDAVWTLRRTKDGKTETRRTNVREPVANDSHDALAAAHSRALARLSQEIAQAILLSASN